MFVVYPGTWVHMLKAVGFPSNLVPAQCKEKFFVTSQEKFNELLVVMANSEDLLEMSGAELSAGSGVEPTHMQANANCFV